MGGKRRNLNTVLNLVTFIDLFSTLILFLLMTAVFDQLASVPVSLGSTDAATVSAPSSPDEARRIEAEIKVTVSDSQVILFMAGDTRTLTREEAVASRFDEIRAFAENVRMQYADKREVVLAATDKALYEDLIGVMDRFLEQDFDQLVVMGVD